MLIGLRSTKRELELLTFLGNIHEDGEKLTKRLSKMVNNQELVAT